MANSKAMAMATGLENADKIEGQFKVFSLGSKQITDSENNGVPTLDHYEMRANEGEKRGICLIINNIKFKKMSQRTGAEKDEEMLSDFFDKELSFQVEVRRNLDVNTFNNVTTHYGRSVDHSQFDAFVCIIMSHGDHHDSIYCVNGKKVYVADIMEDFNGDNCPSLLYKPKLFFIQACRGSPVKLSANGEHHQRDASYQYDSSLARGLCPQEADFLLAFSTAPGYLSERDPATGTRFIQVLIKVMKEYHHYYHLLDMLVEVTKRVVAMGTGSNNSQVPASSNTLRAQVFL